MAMGVLLASGLARRNAVARGARKQARPATPLPLASEPLETMRVPTAQLMAVILQRGRVSVAMRLGSIRKRSR
jgi:hypothetical protein